MMVKHLGQLLGVVASFRKSRAVLILFLILAVVTAIRIRLLSMPLERDEGEFAYAAQLFLQGLSPYQHAYNTMLKLPGTCAAYALSMAVFGQTAGAIHGGVIFVNLASAWLVFLLARRMFGDPAAVVASGTFALLALSPGTLGLAAHATHFVMLPALAGIYLLQNLGERTRHERIFAAGLLLGLAVIMKQSGAAFGLFAAMWVTRCEFGFESWHWRRWLTRLIWLALGGILPLAFLCEIVTLTGDFNNFWFWSVEYAQLHISLYSFHTIQNAALNSLIHEFTSDPGLWSLAAAGMMPVLFEKSLRPWRFFIVSLLLFSYLAVSPGWYFREHYFIQMLPVAGLLAAAAFVAAARFSKRWQSALNPVVIPSVIFAIAAMSALIQWRDIYFFFTPDRACRAIYYTNPFPEAVKISEYLDLHCAIDAKILVLGSEPEIYFYSRHHSATSYICTYPLMERQPYAADMQKDMICQIEQAKPEYVIFVSVRASWLQSNDSTDPYIFEWFQHYQQLYLQQVGLVDIISGDQTDYKWFGSPESITPPRSDCWLGIFKRREAANDHK